MTYLEFIRKIQSRSLASLSQRRSGPVESRALAECRVFVFQGPDDFLKTKALQCLRALPALGGTSNPTATEEPRVFLSDDFDGPAFLNELYSVPFFQKEKLVVLKLTAGARAEILASLEKYLAAPSLFSRLAVFTDTPIKNSAVNRLINGKGLAVDCYKISEYEMPQWVIAETAAMGKRISPQNARIMVERVGNDLGKVDALVRNLVLFAGARTEIELSDIDKFVTADRLYETKQLARMITQGRTAEAVRIIRQLMLQGEPINMVIGYLAWYFKSESASGLKSKLRLLLETDIAVKTGVMNEDLAGEMLVLKLTTR